MSRVRRIRESFRLRQEYAAEVLPTGVSPRSRMLFLSSCRVHCLFRTSKSSVVRQMIPIPYREDGEQAEPVDGKDSKHELVETGDMPRDNQGQENEAAGKRLFRGMGVRSSASAASSQGQRECTLPRLRSGCFTDGHPIWIIGEKCRYQSSVRWREGNADAVTIEGVKNENDDRQMMKRDQRGIIVRTLARRDGSLPAL